MFFNILKKKPYRIHFWPLQGHTIHTSHCFDGFQSYFRLGLTHFELTVGQEMEYIDKRYRLANNTLSSVFDGDSNKTLTKTICS